MDLENQNQLLNVTCSMLKSFFNTEIIVNDGEILDSEEENNESKDFHTNRPIIQPFQSDDLIPFPNVDVDKYILTKYTPNMEVLDYYLCIIEKKFYSIHENQTLSLINYIIRHGSKFQPEFFYMIFRLLTNEHKNKITRAASIIQHFLLNGNDAVMNLFRSMILINQDNLISIDIYENIIVLLQILYLYQYLNFEDASCAFKKLINGKENNFEPFYKSNFLFSDVFKKNQNFDIKSKRQIDLLTKENQKLKLQIASLSEKNAFLLKQIEDKDAELKKKQKRL